MKFTSLRFLSICCFALLGAITDASKASTTLSATSDSFKLPRTVEAQLKKLELPSSALSVVVLPAQGDRAVLSHQADRSFAPGSSIKLITSFIALDRLGPNYKWKTQFLSDAVIRDGVLNGNLYLRGGGDPNLSYDKFALMLRALRQLGIREIQGDLILDRSFFQPARPEIGAPAFDESPDAYYNVIPDALLIHSNITAFAINSENKDKNENPITVQVQTPNDNLLLRNQLTLNNRPCADWKSQWQSPQTVVNEQGQIEITLSGSFPKNCQTLAYLNVIERNAYIASLFRGLWKELGGNWQGNVYDGATPFNASLLHERASETLADTLRIVNKNSDNAMARILYLTLGAESLAAKNFSDTKQAAFAEVRNWFARNGLSAEGIVMENGSGLSRTERISANQMASVLRVGAGSLWYPEFASSLPIAGLDGTMKNRLKAGNAEARARIKTGTLRNSIAVAGFVRDTSQTDWIIVAFINTPDGAASRGRPVLDELINWVASGRSND